MEPSEVIGDRYELLDAIGRGGMATIYRALDHRMGRTVAVKILREVYSTDPKFVTRFQREAQAASALQHPNIVQVFDFGQSNGYYYIVMEFIAGTDLRQYLKREGILENEQAIEIARDVALGLGMAHRRGIVHRDVKPQNILMSEDGIIKLTDFGIASVYKDADDERLTTTGMTLGTVQYYAPEQAQGEIVRPPADVYALGIVLYEMLAGRTPFDGDSPVAVAMKHIQEPPEPPRHFNPNIWPGLERLILRCLEKDPRDRYPNGDALAYALEQTMRAPGGRRAAPSPPPVGRGQFVSPLNLPGDDGAGPALGARSALQGGTAVASGPRGAPYAAPYGGSQPGGEPMYDVPGAYPSAPPTRPNEAAPATVPGMPSWPGAQRADQGGQRGNGAMAALIAGTALFLLLACVLAAAVFGVPSALGKLIGGSPAVTPTAAVQLVTVPQFVGETWTQAQQDAQAKGLKVTETVVTNSAPKNQVVGQDPAAGTQIDPRTQTVALQVSGGPGKVKVPDVTAPPYMSLAQACNLLQQAQLVCQNSTAPVYSAVVPFGDVVSTQPKAGTLVAPQSTVILTISNGPAPTPTPTVTPTPAVTPTGSP